MSKPKKGNPKKSRTRNSRHTEKRGYQPTTNLDESNPPRPTKEGTSENKRE